MADDSGGQESPRTYTEDELNAAIQAALEARATNAQFQGGVLSNPTGVPDNVTPGLPGVPRSLSGNDARSVLQAIGAESTAPRAALIREALTRQGALSRGSQAALFQALRPQISALRDRLQQTFDAIDRRLGPRSSGGIAEARGQEASQAALALQALLSQGALSGFGGVFNQASGVQPGLATSLRPIGTASSGGGFPTNLGGLIQAVAGVGERLYQGFNNANDAANAQSTIEGFRSNPDTYSSVFGSYGSQYTPDAGSGYGTYGDSSYGGGTTIGDTSIQYIE